MRNWPVNMTLQSLANLFLGQRVHRGEGRVKYFPDVLIKSLGRNWGTFWVFLIILRYVEQWQHPHYWTFDLHKFIHRKATIQLGGTRQP